MKTHLLVYGVFFLLFVVLVGESSKKQSPGSRRRLGIYQQGETAENK